MVRTQDITDEMILNCLPLGAEEAKELKIPKGKMWKDIQKKLNWVNEWKKPINDKTIRKRFREIPSEKWDFWKARDESDRRTYGVREEYLYRKPLPSSNPISEVIENNTIQIVMERSLADDHRKQIDTLLEAIDEQPKHVLARIEHLNTSKNGIYLHSELMTKFATIIQESDIDKKIMDKVIDIYCRLWARAVYSHPGFAQDTAWLESAPFRQLWELSQLDSLSDAQRKLLRTEIKMVFKHYYTKDRPLNDDWMKGLIREILNNPDPGSFYGEILLYYANEKDRRTMVENLDAAWKDGKCEGVGNSKKEQLDDLLNHSKLINYRPC